MAKGPSSSSMRLALVAACWFVSQCPAAQSLDELGDRDTGQVRWIKQRANTERFKFEVLTASAEEAPRSPRGLRIRDRRTGALLQEFGGIDGGDVLNAPHAIVSVIDANFDGLADVALARDRGGIGPNNTANFYLYDARKKRFAFSQRLSALTQVQFNKDRSISSYERSGCCVHYESRYRFLNQHLTLIASTETSTEGAGTVTVKTGTLINGRMKYTTVTRSEAGR